MYSKYHTEALVLGSRERGESDRTYALYTKEFGLVYARAVSVRAEYSRLRYGLSNYSHVQVSLVRGKREWKIVGVSLPRVLSGEGAAVFARIARLVMRLVGGEEANNYLFSALAEAHAYFFCESTHLASAELVCVGRALFSLGYISNESLGTTLFLHTAYQEEHLHEAELLRQKLVVSVNRAITESQL